MHSAKARLPVSEFVVRSSVFYVLSREVLEFSEKRMGFFLFWPIFFHVFLQDFPFIATSLGTFRVYLAMYIDGS